MLLKFLTQQKRFDPCTLSFGSYMLVSGVLTAAGVIYWFAFEFDFTIFVIAFFGSIVGNIGLVLVNLSYTCGPSGPVAALGSSSIIVLTFILAVLDQKIPSDFELFGLILGSMGVSLIAFPEYIDSFFAFICCNGGSLYA